MTRRFNNPDDPFRETNIETCGLYVADLDYLQERGLPLRTVIREALRAYVQVLQARTPGPVMTARQRDTFIMRGILPNGTRYQDPPDKIPVAVVVEKPRLYIQAHELRPDMTGWTKAQRDAWILNGTVPGDEGLATLSPQQAKAVFHV